MFHSEQLLPCPFCGNKPKKHHLVNSGYVLCGSCEVQVIARAETMEEAMSLWNARFTTTQAPKPAVAVEAKTKSDTSYPYVVGRDYYFSMPDDGMWGTLLEIYDREFVIKSRENPMTGKEGVVIILSRGKVLWVAEETP